MVDSKIIVIEFFIDNMSMLPVYFVAQMKYIKHKKNYTN